MKEFCETYVKNILIIGALFCIVPLFIAVFFILLFWDFRKVYLVRLAISMVFGGFLGALSNKYAIDTWFLHMKGKKSLKAIPHGAAMGLFAGFCTSLVPPLTGLICSNNKELTNKVILGTWSFGAVFGTLFGSFVGYMGNEYLLEE